MSDSTPQPTVTAMLICDQIIGEGGTNKKSLIGIFEAVGVPQFPVAIPRMAIYVRLVDAFGHYQFKLRVVNLKDESLLSEFTVPGDIKDRFHANELVFNLVNFPILAPGKYEFQLLANDLFCNRVTLEAVAAPMPPIQQQGGIVPWQPRP